MWVFSVCIYGSELPGSVLFLTQAVFSEGACDNSVFCGQAVSGLRLVITLVF